MKILIIGMGSIGTRHAKNFRSLNVEVLVHSSRPQSEFEEFDCEKSNISDAKFDWVLVCNETSKHLSTLLRIRELGYTGKVLIEKPIFEIVPAPDLFQTENVYVAYNLRFHKMLKDLKQELKNQSVASSLLYVGQYLPTWRPNVDYRKSYSANKAMGGGVVLDLSHELDLAIWLFGEVTQLAANSGKLSQLEIDVEDSASILMAQKACSQTLIQMNYMDRMTNRFLLVNTQDHSYKLDLIAKTFQKDQKITNYSVEGNDSYMNMSKAILENKLEDLCDFDQAIQVLKLGTSIKAKNAERF